MTDEPTWFRDDLEPDVPGEERGMLWSVADALIAGRPNPRAAFRAALHQRVTSTQARGGAFERPQALWTRVVSLALPGAALLCLVAIGVAGAGPFAK